MRLFVTGASGYIGGSFAAEAVRRGHDVRGLVRSAEKAAACAALGMVPVQGTLADRDLLIEEAQRADVVVNAASSDERDAVDTFLAALSGSGKAFLHTSGSSLVADHAEGEASEAIFDERHMPLPVAGKAPRVALDHAILTTPGIRSIILCNSLIYGKALGPTAHSVQLPLLVDYARENGCARYIGKGLNRWSTVHIADVVDLYFLALEQAPPATFVFVESGEASFRDMAQSIANALRLGEATSMTVEAAIKRWGRQRALYSLASNSRVRSLYSRAWGWKPNSADIHTWILNNISAENP
ncbi:Nucleoside-diphosphate-sugar epimerase [Acetobacter malorum]|nr:Nucleoside-diphosphate-sugar epimerase [Acetobacter malorum]